MSKENKKHKFISVKVLIIIIASFLLAYLVYQYETFSVERIPREGAVETAGILNYYFEDNDNVRIIREINRKLLNTTIASDSTSDYEKIAFTYETRFAEFTNEQTLKRDSNTVEQLTLLFQSNEFKSDALDYLYSIQNIIETGEIKEISIENNFCKNVFFISKVDKLDFINAYINDVIEDPDFGKYTFTPYDFYTINFFSRNDGEVDYASKEYREVAIKFYPVHSSFHARSFSIKPTYKNTLEFFKNNETYSKSYDKDFTIIKYKSKADNDTLKAAVENGLNYAHFNERYTYTFYSVDEFTQRLKSDSDISDISYYSYHDDTKEVTDFLLQTKPFLKETNYFLTRIVSDKELYRLAVYDGVSVIDYGVFYK